MKGLIIVSALVLLLVVISGFWQVLAVWSMGAITQIADLVPDIGAVVVKPTTQDNSGGNCGIMGCGKNCGYRNKASTDALIQCSFLKGEISESQRVLYLFYALGDPSKSRLPEKYKSVVPWDGTSVVDELNSIVSDPDRFCKLSQEVREEIKRVSEMKVTRCDGY